MDTDTHTGRSPREDEGRNYEKRSVSGHKLLTKSGRNILLPLQWEILQVSLPALNLAMAVSRPHSLTIAQCLSSRKQKVSVIKLEGAGPSLNLPEGIFRKGRMKAKVCK